MTASERPGDALEDRLRALAAQVEAEGIPPHLAALAQRLAAALAARPDPEPEAAERPLARG